MNIFQRIFFIGCCLSSLHAKAQNTYLWKISKATSPHISFLFGTYHKIGESFFNQYPVLKEAFNASEDIVTEVELNRQKLSLLYKDKPATDSLRQTLDPKDYQQVLHVLGDSSDKIKKLDPESVVSRLQSRFESLNCSALQVTDQYFLDEYIQVLAEKLNKKNHYLETVNMQLTYLEETKKKMSWSQARFYIKIILKQYSKYKKSGKTTCSLADNYTQFRLQYQLDQSCKNLNADKKKLVVQRNQKWMLLLPTLIEKNSTFISVGLEHLHFECGLIMQLRKLGYSVEPIPMLPADVAS
ncbi:TraB/GumN family protein [Niabella sp. CJ426]|uniref:TraB/GumN family protein n=1 Tax=Niabella sp. CJ426 TaxID=3393740 RepID=UPI003CFF48A3